MGSIKKNHITAGAFRIVEIQTRKAILKLVDAEEAEILDAMLEVSKPPIPEAVEDFDRLIFTPFRYPPLKHGSRFGYRAERGIWYGAEELKTALCEVSYYKFRFFEESPEMRRGGSIIFDWTSFHVKVASTKSADLCTGQYKAQKARVSSPTTYRYSQPLGTALRSKGIELIKFFSARDPKGVNIAAFEPNIFSSPKNRAHWICRWENDVISIRAYDLEKISQKFEFRRDQYLVKGKFPIVKS